MNKDFQLTYWNSNFYMVFNEIMVGSNSYTELKEMK